MEKILIVDDEPGVLELCKRVLKRDGYNILTATSGEEALEILPKEMFDLVLTDLKLTGLNGIELIKKIKSSYPQTEVMVITGQATIETAIESLKSGAYDYITKPFNISELGAAVKKSLEYSRLRVQENIFRETTYLYRLAQEISKSHSESDLINFILERAVKALHSDAGSIFIFEPTKSTLSPMAIYGSYHSDEIKLGEGIAGWVAQNRQPLLLQDGLGNMPQFKGLPVRPNIVSSMVAPLIDKEVLLGVICLNRFVGMTNYQFTHRDLESLQIFALHATLILSALRYQQALRDLDKLKSEFMANVSHELRTPLMAISGAVELLNNYIVSSDSNQKIGMIMDLVGRNTDRMRLLVNELLDFARLETKQKKLVITRFSLNELIEETIEDFTSRAKEKDISLMFNTSEEKVDMSTDRERIKQIISNLISNSIKFTSEKGKIEVGYTKRNNGSVLMTVFDNGIGIPKEKQDKIFEKFFQVDGSISRSHAGFGLGLAIVKSAVDVLKGKIWVESKINEGSKFFVLMPINSDND